MDDLYENSGKKQNEKYPTSANSVKQFTEVKLSIRVYEVK